MDRDSNGPGIHLQGVASHDPVVQAAFDLTCESFGTRFRICYPRPTIERVVLPLLKRVLLPFLKPNSTKVPRETATTGPANGTLMLMDGEDPELMGLFLEAVGGTDAPIVSIQTAYKGVGMMGISIDEGKYQVKTIRKFVDKVGVSYPVFSDAAGTPAWHTFGIKAIPTLFLIDQDRQIVAQWQGSVDHKVVEKEIQKHIR